MPGRDGKSTAVAKRFGLAEGNLPVVVVMKPRKNRGGKYTVLGYDVMAEFSTVKRRKLVREHHSIAEF